MPLQFAGDRRISAHYGALGCLASVRGSPSGITQDDGSCILVSTFTCGQIQDMWQMDADGISHILQCGVIGDWSIQDL